MYDMNTGNETWEWVNLKEVITITLGVTMKCSLILFVYDLYLNNSDWCFYICIIDISGGYQMGR